MSRSSACAVLLLLVWFQLEVDAQECIAVDIGRGEEVSTFPALNPKWPLENVRFVFEDRSGVYIELTSSPALRAAVRSVTSSNWNEVRDALPGAAPLSDDRAERLLGYLPESIGDEFTVIFSDTSIEVLALRGLALAPTGDGAYDGIWGRLEASRDGISKSRIAESCVRGLAYATRKPTTIDQKLPIQSDMEIDEAEALILGRQLAQNYAVVSIAPMYCFFSSARCYALTLRDKKSDETQLSCFVLSGDAWLPMPWRSDAALTSELGVVFENPESETDYKMINSKLIAFPDLDGNGGSELLVVSDNIALLFALQLFSTSQNEICVGMTEVKSVYFGP